MYFKHLDHQVYFLELTDHRKPVLKAPFSKRMYSEYMDYQGHFVEGSEVGNMARPLKTVK